MIVAIISAGLLRDKTVKRCPCIHFQWAALSLPQRPSCTIMNLLVKSPSSIPTIFSLMSWPRMCSISLSPFIRTAMCHLVAHGQDVRVNKRFETLGYSLTALNRPNQYATPTLATANNVYVVSIDRYNHLTSCRELMVMKRTSTNLNTKTTWRRVTADSSLTSEMKESYSRQ